MQNYQEALQTIKDKQQIFKMRNLKIKILDGDAYWMTKYADANGNVYLDTDSEFTILY